MRVIWPFGKSEYFFLRGLTAFADLPVGLFCRTRGIEIALARGAKQSALSADSGPNSASHRSEATLSATTGLAHRGKQQNYSITWSTATSKDCGTARPSAFAVLRLMTSSNFVGCSMGIAPGLVPFNI